MDSPNGVEGNEVTNEAVQIVKQVLVYGKRTLPIYVNEHDMLGNPSLTDIGGTDNNGVYFNQFDTHSYIPHVTKVHQDPNRIRGGGTWTFYCFPGGPDSGADPFGYTSKFGSDFCYEFDDLSSDTDSGSGITIKWPFVAAVTNHWFYDDIDFTKGVYRFAKAATKQIDYKPEAEDDVLNKNNVSVKLEATLGSKQGIIYQVADPETTGPNKAIKKLFKQKYYKYDGTLETSQKIENAKAVDSKKSKYTFNGEQYSADKSAAKEVSKEEVDFKENKTEALAAFGILENMHTEASDYIYRNLKELMISLKYFNTQELTEDLQSMLLWPIKTDNQNTTWELSKDEKNFGTVIKCTENEKTVVAPSEAKIKKIEGNTITLEFTNMSDKSYELLEYIYESKDPYKKINKELVTGMQLKIKDIKVDSSLKVGKKVKRGQTLGKATGKTDGQASITITMYNLDKSIVEDISTYFRQEENTKYEELMKAKKEAPEEYKEGLDISSILNNLTVATGWRAEVIRQAKTQIGVPYKRSATQWGTLIDCSGLTYMSYKLAGIDIPRCQAIQYAGKNSQMYYIRTYGTWKTNVEDLEPGDIVFYGHADKNYVTSEHVAIYLGDGKVIEATDTPEGVSINNVIWLEGTKWRTFIGGGYPPNV